MLKYVLTIITVAIITPTVLTYDGDCCPQIEDDGFYCTNDLSGYYNCYYDGSYWCMGTGAEVRCPSGTRCSCYIDHWCTMNTSSICVSYESPAPYLETFSLKYDDFRYYKSLNPHLDPHYNTSNHGVVLRDAAQKKYFWKEGDISELIFQNKEGKFMKYRWWDSKPGKCEKSNFGYLPYFSDGNDINKYNLLSSTKTGTRDLQKWYFQVGRNSWAFDFYKKWWTVSYDHAINRILPVKYYQEHIGDEMADYTIYTTITWSINHHQSSAAMELPSFCIS